MFVGVKPHTPAFIADFEPTLHSLTQFPSSLGDLWWNPVHPEIHIEIFGLARLVPQIRRVRPGVDADVRSVAELDEKQLALVYALDVVPKPSCVRSFRHEDTQASAGPREATGSSPPA
jgi:hypothetical protein